ncbi:hypothetical protein AB4305_21760 [Nocardia sp. 2YAB30]|uniref:hypothetical protein n=1 Tax=Nocardia sp. 2YAB30 TaxID=3233022 RepID=UPI003F9AD60E
MKTPIQRRVRFISRDYSPARWVPRPTLTDRNIEQPLIAGVLPAIGIALWA